MNKRLSKNILSKQDYSDFRVREQLGKLCGAVGIAVNALLCISKIIAGLLFYSISMIADGVNNLSDMGNCVITLVGFRLAAKPADKDHPFGHARYEYIAGLLVAFLIMMLGFSLLKTAIGDIFAPKELVFSRISLGVLGGSIVLKLWLWRFYRRIGIKMDSVALRAAAQDSLNDVFSTGAVLISMVASKLFLVQLDGYMGVLVSGLVLYSGFGLINETLSPLLGEAPKEELVRMIEQEIREFDDSIIGIHDLVVHHYGANRCFATVHVELPATQNVLVSHDIVDNIETHFRKHHQIQLVIHMDPVETDNPEVGRLRSIVEQVVSQLSQELSIHDFRVAFGDKRNNLIFDVVVPYDFHYSDEWLEQVITEKVSEMEKSSGNEKQNFCVIEFDRRYS